MIYQVTLYEGNWNKKVSEKIVWQLLRKRARSIQFYEPDEDVKLSFEIDVVMPMYRDCECVRDRLYRSLYRLGPEYESMVEVELE